MDAGFRVGLGYDSHRLSAHAGRAERGRPMVVGGIRLASDHGPVAHSDGDALMHAVTDAVLGAAGLADIGELFPDTDPRWAGTASEIFLTEAVRRAGALGWSVINIDATVILERPKLAPHKPEIRANLARILGVAVERVNIKGKTHELLDPTQSGQKIEAHAVALMGRAAHG